MVKWAGAKPTHEMLLACFYLEAEFDVHIAGVAERPHLEHEFNLRRGEHVLLGVDVALAACTVLVGRQLTCGGHGTIDGVLHHLLPGHDDAMLQCSVFVDG